MKFNTCKLASIIMSNKMKSVLSRITKGLIEKRERDTSHSMIREHATNVSARSAQDGFG